MGGAKRGRRRLQNPKIRKRKGGVEQDRHRKSKESRSDLGKKSREKRGKDTMPNKKKESDHNLLS